MGSSSSSGLHAKTFAVDGERIFVGSFNFDPRSALLNTEMGLVIDSPVLAQRLAEGFDTDVPWIAYEVRLAPDGRSLQWVERSAAGEKVYDTEPGHQRDAAAWASACCRCCRSNGCFDVPASHERWQERRMKNSNFSAVQRLDATQAARCGRGSLARASASAGLRRRPECGSDRQLRGAEFRAADVADGSRPDSRSSELVVTNLSSKVLRSVCWRSLCRRRTSASSSRG